MYSVSLWMFFPKNVIYFYIFPSIFVHSFLFLWMIDSTESMRNGRDTIILIVDWKGNNFKRLCHQCPLISLPEQPDQTTSSGATGPEREERKPGKELGLANLDLNLFLCPAIQPTSGWCLIAGNGRGWDAPTLLLRPGSITTQQVEHVQLWQRTGLWWVIG